jgi:ATP-dependent protease HslVU (ClpYQ) peptidase subunit
MTAIVAIANEDEGWVHMGGDSHSADPSIGRNQVRNDVKVWKHGPFVFGVSGSVRQAQIMRYMWEFPPEVNDKPLDFEWMVKYYVPSLRDVLGKGQLAEDEPEAPLPGGVLVGVRGKLYEIQADYQVVDNADAFWSIGAASEYCLGALHALIFTSDCTTYAAPRVAIKIALEAASKYSMFSAPPFTLVEVSKDDD